MEEFLSNVTYIQDEVTKNIPELPPLPVSILSFK